MSSGGAPAAPAISLCMIVRDEEQKLARCLAAAQPVVDEVVIVDTGSTDATRDIAAASGARVADFRWCDNFSAARNRSLELARGAWALVLDADELLASVDARERLLDFARSAGVPAGQVELENLTDDGARSRTLLTRFFDLRVGLRYVRRVHEQLTLNGRTISGRPTGVHVIHDGYSRAALAGRDKLARNEALLRATLADSPDDGYDWYQLGRTLEVGARFPEALEAYEQAIERAKDSDPHLPHLFECAATCLRAVGRSQHALDWLSEVAPLFPERPDMVFLVALLAMDVGELERAERGFLRCLELGARPGRATAAESATAATTIAPLHNLGVLYEFTGRPVKAREAYERALELRPEHRGARDGLQRLGLG
ncbi:MAG: tetratricopeptide repeat protein [Planctomycetota bacterium]